MGPVLFTVHKGRKKGRVDTEGAEQGTAGTLDDPNSRRGKNDRLGHCRAGVSTVLLLYLSPEPYKLKGSKLKLLQPPKYLFTLLLMADNTSVRH